MIPWFVLLAGTLQVRPVAQRESPTVVDVEVRSANPRLLTPGFAGFNVALMESGITYRDRALTLLTHQLSPGWLRYPAGMRSDAFDWTTGLSRQDWVDRFAGSQFHARLQNALDMLAWKGGERIADAAEFARRAGARGLIVCVNVFTDTPASAGELAAFARAHQIPVLAWELGNEPTFFPSFFPSATQYAQKMRAYAESIRTADSSAHIALSMSIAGLADSAWDTQLAQFQPRYWDRLSLHYYPQVRGSSAELEPLHDALLVDVVRYVEREVMARFGTMPVLITEARPDPDLAGTLFSGIWAAEFALRLARLPTVERVGMHQLLGPAGIELSRDHTRELQTYYERSGKALPSLLNYGPFPSAQGVAYSVAASAINASTTLYPTTVSGGRQVARIDGVDSIPLIYAQAFGKGRQRFVVITNKSTSAEAVRISWDGAPIRSTFDVVTATGKSPRSTNSPGQPHVAAKRSRANGVVQIPPYSVVCLSW